jgi:hypothetical protein
LLDAVALTRARTEGALPVHGQPEGARVPAPDRPPLSAVAERRSAATAHSLNRSSDEGDSRSWRPDPAAVDESLPLTSSHAGSATGGADLLPMDADPCLQLSLGFGGNICAATYGAVAP